MEPCSNDNPSPSYPGLPALDKLTMKPRDKLTSEAEDGIYCLDQPGDIVPCDSSIVILRNVLNVTQAETQVLKEYMEDDRLVPPTKNPCNANHNLRRKQATFGAAYKFGRQTSTHVPGDPLMWPAAVQKALKMSQVFVEKRGIAHQVYNVVHVNYYPDGKAGVLPHADDEPELIKGLPIFSYTLLPGDKACHMRRNFVIYTTRQNGKKIVADQEIASVALGHNDLAVMQGSMQQHFFHGVPTTASKAYSDADRLNLTVRAFHVPVTDTSECEEPRAKAARSCESGCE